MNDKELIQKLNQIKATSAGGSPKKDWALSNKEILMSQIRPSTNSETPTEKVNEGVYYFQHFNGLFQQRVMKPVVATFAIMAMLLTYNATTTIANTSVSGDILYPVKTAKEKVQIAFTFDKEDKIKLQMTFISRRTEELHKIALNGSDSTKTQDQIENTAKKIAEDVKTVQDGLNKITIASINENNDSAIELAKEIDTKTLEVKKSIIAASGSLSDDVKEEVFEELKEAIDTTSETGTIALALIITEYETGDSETVGDEELISRVTDRIEDAEDDIVLIGLAVDGVSTTTPQIVSPIDTDDSSTTTTAQTLLIIKDKPQEAQDIIDEAKDLLDSSDFSSALLKVTESGEVVDTAEDGVQSINEQTDSGQVLGADESDNDNSSSTVSVVE